MFTNLMRHWLQEIRRSQRVGKPRRRRQRPSYGSSESLEQRTVLSAQISTIGTATLAAPSDNTIATARELGTLSSTPTTVRDFVGIADTQDHFRFTLTQARNVRVQLSGLSADADVQLLDAQGRIVASSIRCGTTSEDFTSSLSAGTYFIRVVRWSGDTNYNLTLST